MKIDIDEFVFALWCISVLKNEFVFPLKQKSRVRVPATFHAEQCLFFLRISNWRNGRLVLGADLVGERFEAKVTFS